MKVCRSYCFGLFCVRLNRDRRFACEARAHDGLNFRRYLRPMRREFVKELSMQPAKPTVAHHDYVISGFGFTRNRLR